MYNPLQHFFRWLAAQLSRFGLIDGVRGKRTADLAWPRMITGLARRSQRVADLVMVGFVAGPGAIAGLAFAAAYWAIGNSFTLSLTGGTINQVSQRFGADKHDELDLAVKQSVLIGLTLGIPLTVGYWLLAEPLVALLSSDPVPIRLGSTYLKFLGLAMVPNFMNTIASRTLAGADDTWIPMSIRATGATANIVLNTILIFGLGLGVLGAALGTVLAELLVTLMFVWGFLGGRIPYIGAFPVRLTITGPYFDADLSSQLLKVAMPLIVRRFAQKFARFPLLAILAMFGPAVVAAYEVARRVRGLAHTPGWGFNISASSLVGQELGKGNETKAQAYASDIIRFMLVVYIALTVILLVFARPITMVFVRDPSTLSETILFVRVGALALLGKGIDGVATGILKGAGDTSWPLYARFVGQYAFMLPIAYLGTVTPIGVIAVYAAFFAETAVPAAITWYRFRSGKWKIVSRSLRPSPTD